jgi:Tfp pilus assembly protein PilF
LSLAPESASAHHLAGMVYEAIGDPAQALEHYTRAVQAAPADGVARFARGVLLLKERKYKEAKEDLAQACKLTRVLETSAKGYLDECEKGLGTPK